MQPENHQDPGRLNELVGALYGDLHRIAARHLRKERSDHTLQATALLHEAYLKLQDDGQRSFKDRVHFLAMASRVMRQVLVDHARARATHKRGSAKVGKLDNPASLERLAVAPDQGIEPIEILELDRALESLAQEDEALAQLVEMHYFGGMTAQEAADALDRSVHVVRHDLRFAQAWLRRELRG